MVGTTYDGRNNVWELTREITNEKTGEEKVVANKFAEYETRGGFGLAVDVVSTTPCSSFHANHSGYDGLRTNHLDSHQTTV